MSTALQLNQIIGQLTEKKFLLCCDIYHERSPVGADTFVCLVLYFLLTSEYGKQYFLLPDALACRCGYGCRSFRRHQQPAALPA